MEKKNLGAILSKR